MDKTYDAYKVVFSNGGFPVYKKTFSAAEAVANFFYSNTGKEVTIYGFLGETIRHIKTLRNPART